MRTAAVLMMVAFLILLIVLTMWDACASVAEAAVAGATGRSGPRGVFAPVPDAAAFVVVAPGTPRAELHAFDLALMDAYVSPECVRVVSSLADVVAEARRLKPSRVFVARTPRFRLARGTRWPAVRLAVARFRPGRTIRFGSDARLLPTRRVADLQAPWELATDADLSRLCAALPARASPTALGHASLDALAHHDATTQEALAGVVYRHLPHPLADLGEACAAAPTFPLSDGAVVINLKHRTDRWVDFQDNLERVGGVPRTSVLRREAVRDSVGERGRLQSHAACLRFMLEQTAWRSMAVFEDDFRLSVPLTQCTSLLSEVGEWDVFQFDAVVVRELRCLFGQKRIVRVGAALSTAFYVLRRPAAALLLALCEATLARPWTGKNDTGGALPLDRAWAPMQRHPDVRWFAPAQRVGRQAPGFSDVSARLKAHAATGSGDTRY